MALHPWYYQVHAASNYPGMPGSVWGILFHWSSPTRVCLNIFITLCQRNSFSEDWSLETCNLIPNWMQLRSDCCYCKSATLFITPSTYIDNGMNCYPFSWPPRDDHDGHVNICHAEAVMLMSHLTPCVSFHIYTIVWLYPWLWSMNNGYELPFHCARII